MNGAACLPRISLEAAPVFLRRFRRRHAGGSLQGDHLLDQRQQITLCAVAQ
jgi:hypothetical protein